jgi:hypothetical protein
MPKIMEFYHLYFIRTIAVGFSGHEALPALIWFHYLRVFSSSDSMLPRNVKRPVCDKYVIAYRFVKTKLKPAFFHR